MRIALKGPFSPYSGYGSDLIGLTLAAVEAGHDVLLIPTCVQPPIPAIVASLLTKPLAAPFDFLINHTDPSALEVTSPERYAANLIVGHTMWEYTDLDNMRGYSKVRKATKDYDCIFAYDAVTQEALQPRVSVPVPVLQGGYTAADWPKSKERDWFGPLRFCMVGALSQRKDPFVALEAFRELKEEKPEFAEAQLYMKNNIASLHPGIEEWIPGVKIITETWSQAKLLDFMNICHVLLAPSRGEGKNMPALQMLSTGGTVIATNWGGHTGWLTSSIGYPLDFQLAQVQPGKKAQNARASKEHLKELMWKIFNNRFEARERGELAARTIPAMCDWSTVLANMLLQLRDIGPRKKLCRQ